MSSRSDILSKIKKNKPEFLALPELDLSHFHEDFNLQDQFKKMVEAVGGDLLIAESNSSIIDKISTLFPDCQLNYATLKEAEKFNTLALKAIKNSSELEDLDILVLEGLFGVAENGAVWIPNSNIPIRVSPFICKHLVLVIDKNKILLTMHQAYEQLEGNDFDYGIFISGPSKTADIEQSLVIGAQGALSLTVFLR